MLKTQARPGVPEEPGFVTGAFSAYEGAYPDGPHESHLVRSRLGDHAPSILSVTYDAAQSLQRYR